jgi:hypothetical protein
MQTIEMAIYKKRLKKSARIYVFDSRKEVGTKLRVGLAIPTSEDIR